jgi:hypothetical protein
VILSLAWQVTRRAAAGWCWRCGCQPSRPGTGWRSGGSASQLQVAGKCLDANGQGSTNGSKVTLWTCNGQANQEWTRPDPALAHFSIGHDLGYIVPDLKEALALNPGLKLMANPKTLAAKHDSSVADADLPRGPETARGKPDLIARSGGMTHRRCLAACRRRALTSSVQRPGRRSCGTGSRVTGKTSMSASSPA